MKRKIAKITCQNSIIEGKIVFGLELDDHDIYLWQTLILGVW